VGLSLLAHAAPLLFVGARPSAFSVLLHVVTRISEPAQRVDQERIRRRTEIGPNREVERGGGSGGSGGRMLPAVLPLRKPSWKLLVGLVLPTCVPAFIGWGHSRLERLSWGGGA